MGNQQDRMRQRAGTAGLEGGPMRPRTYSEGSGTGPDHPVPMEDECPVQVKIAKQLSEQQQNLLCVSGMGPEGSTPSFQYEDTGDYPVVVKWHGGVQPKKVSLLGSWDNWKKKIPLVRSTEDFSTILNLPEGKHQMKFEVDGKWTCDETLPKTDNGIGGHNNVLSIDRGDFEVFDALDRDLATSGCRDPVKRAEGGNHETPNERELEKMKNFTQEIPDKRDFERSTHPPVLPPHLLQVMLNKDTPVQCDPNVLPEPNHVMLNHLYALSIKDGVMVLSATHRYRKKYVTTLLYKPI